MQTILKPEGNGFRNINSAQQAPLSELVVPKWPCSRNIETKNIIQRFGKGCFRNTISLRGGLFCIINITEPLFFLRFHQKNRFNWSKNVFKALSFANCKLWAGPVINIHENGQHQDLLKGDLSIDVTQDRG